MEKTRKLIRTDKNIAIDGTVKEHSEYLAEKQTVLTRCKVGAAA